MASAAFWHLINQLILDSLRVANRMRMDLKIDNQIWPGAGFDRLGFALRPSAMITNSAVPGLKARWPGG